MRIILHRPRLQALLWVFAAAVLDNQQGRDLARMSPLLFLSSLFCLFFVFVETFAGRYSAVCFDVDKALVLQYAD